MLPIPFAGELPGTQDKLREGPRCQGGADGGGPQEAHPAAEGSGGTDGGGEEAANGRPEWPQEARVRHPRPTGAAGRGGQGEGGVAETAEESPGQSPVAVVIGQALFRESIVVWELLRELCTESFWLAPSI